MTVWQIRSFDVNKIFIVTINITIIITSIPPPPSPPPTTAAAAITITSIVVVIVIIIIFINIIIAFIFCIVFIIIIILIVFFILHLLRGIFIPLYHHHIFSFLHSRFIVITIYTCSAVKFRMRRSAKLCGDLLSTQPISGIFSYNPYSHYFHRALFQQCTYQSKFYKEWPEFK